MAQKQTECRLRTLLVLRATLSAISLLKSWAIAWISSRELEISLIEYLNLLLSLGKGLPLEKLRSGLMKQFDLRGLPLDPLLVRVLAAGPEDKGDKSGDELILRAVSSM